MALFKLNAPVTTLPSLRLVGSKREPGGRASAGCLACRDPVVCLSSLLHPNNRFQLPLLLLPSPLAAAKPGNPVPDGTNVLIVGWGATDSKRETLAETLQMVRTGRTCKGRGGWAALCTCRLNPGQCCFVATVPQAPNLPRRCTRPILQLPEKVLPLSTCQAAWGAAVDWNGDGVVDPENFLTNTMMCAARERAQGPHGAGRQPPGRGANRMCRAQRTAPPLTPLHLASLPITCLQAPTIQTTSRGSAPATRAAR